jgi:hypothetical protein
MFIRSTLSLELQQFGKVLCNIGSIDTPVQRVRSQDDLPVFDFTLAVTARHVAHGDDLKTNLSLGYFVHEALHHQLVLFELVLDLKVETTEVVIDRAPKALSYRGNVDGLLILQEETKKVRNVTAWREGGLSHLLGVHDHFPDRVVVDDEINFCPKELLPNVLDHGIPLCLPFISSGPFGNEWESIR